MHRAIQGNIQLFLVVTLSGKPSFDLPKNNQQQWPPVNIKLA